MLLLDGICVEGQNTRERGFTPVMSVAKLSSLCKYRVMCLPARVVARKDGSGQLQEEARHPLPSQMEIYCVGFY